MNINIVSPSNNVWLRHIALKTLIKRDKVEIHKLFVRQQTHAKYRAESDVN